jgi:anti-sigma B factor antagonist
MNLLLSARRHGPETTISVAGEVDLGSGERLFEYVLETVRRHGPRLVVDLAGVTFMDCGGVRVLMAIRTRTGQLGGYLHVVAASRSVHRVLGILGLDQSFAALEQSEVDTVVLPAQKVAGGAGSR